MPLIDKSNIDPDVTEFINFMKRHFKKKEDKHIPITHTLMGPLHETRANVKGAFNIEGIDYNTFITLYKKAVTKMDMHIVERPCIVGPMLIDIDFKTHKKFKERQYLDEHIEYIIKKYTKYFKKYLNICNDDLKAYVLEKPSPTYDEKNQNYKDGFHIVYPHIALDVKKRYYFFDITKKEIVTDDGFKDIPFINEYDDILDSSVIMNNGWLMYGAHKEGRDPYSLTKIYNYDMTEESLDNYDDNELISLLSVKTFNDEDDTTLKKKYKDIDDEIEKTYLNYTDTKTKKKNKTNTNTNNNLNMIDNDFDDDFDDKKLKKVKKQLESEFGSDDEALKTDYKMAKALAKIFSNRRATKYEDWRNVGWALYNVSDKLLNSFLEFSKKASNYDEQGCKDFWEKAEKKKDGFTMSSLHYWGKSDDKEGYLKVMRERVKDLIFKAESGTHDDIAVVVHEMYKHLYKCVNIGKNIWYEFQDGRWVQIDSAYTLREKIANELTKEFFVLHSYYMNKASAEDAIERDEVMKKGKLLIQIQTKLKTVGFQKSVIEACACKFYDKKFEESLNSNPYLVGFENGVFELNGKDNGTGYFRKGLPDDLISMSTGYDYEEFDRNSREIKDIEKYFSQVQTDSELREYVLKLIASFMDGRIIDQKFPIWTGSGCHAGDEQILMGDGSLRSVQDIKLGEYVMGADGRKRKVIVEFKGTADLYTVYTFDEADTQFTVNKKHRLAIRCHFEPTLTKTFDDASDKDIYWVTYHELCEDGPIELEKKFLNEEDAMKFILELENNPNAVQYGEVIPVSVERLTIQNEEAKERMEKVMQHYKLFKQNSLMEHDTEFTIIEADELHGDFFGFELDGDKKYVMGNGYVTYNSNGKSATTELIQNMMGDYAGMLPNTVLTRKAGNSSSAVPELADKRGKRFLILQEPDQNEQIYVGKMKEMTGNDRIMARALYGDPFYYRPQFKLVLACNVLPQIPTGDDMGTWRRIVKVPWNSKFCKEPKLKNEFLIDTTLSKKMESWGPAFAWLILNVYYPKYIQDGLTEPEIVKIQTAAYKKDSDVFMEFLDEYIEKTEDNSSETIDYVYSLFKGWFIEAYNKGVKPKKDLINYLTNNKYEVNKGLIKKVKVVMPEDRQNR
jgi:phage/plasmid-associated DNA primase